MEESATSVIIEQLQKLSGSRREDFTEDTIIGSDINQIRHTFYFLRSERIPVIISYMGETYQVRSDWQFGYPLFKGTLNGTEICIQVERRDMIYRLFHWGSQADMMVLSPRIADLQALMPVKAPPDLSKFLLSPMPGLLT